MTRTSDSIRASDAAVEVRHLGLVDYVETWEMQADLAKRRAAGEIVDTLLVLQHPNTYTAGKRTQPEDLPDNDQPVVTVDRGGRITWHGEGQIVVYPIVKLADPVDVLDFVRRVEEAMIRTVRELGVTKATRVDGRSGVWIPADSPAADPRAFPGERKVAQLGIRVTHGVTMHGLAINCNNTLDYFNHIVACGIADAGVTTLSLELGRDVTPEEVTDPLIAHLTHTLDHGL
ncbi:lipoyl(octanoyl) transferase LipB [Corynebacterium aquatimens]|uniref:Octanoyltransferase n=1 Tax=Corynebacterium aquatimens TaxID=1190508 RepID=A0A931E1N2_9CORY|nr:lipoyl(octanoyl) transferase LipB [Corynebacterium aquatimens]MBG6122005.1 lipoyl(octanoyl) transferase [Corynebacterium aquatimens]WJY65456.1 Octanoyltransferase [Corynebacterium aquatimens]